MRTYLAFFALWHALGLAPSPQMLQNIIHGNTHAAGGGAITRLDHKLARSASQTASATTGPMNCSGGNWLGAVVTNYGTTNSAAALTVTSSPSNSFSHTSNYTGGGSLSNVAVFYATSASLNGSTTITVGASGTTPNYVAISGFCYSNFASGALDKQIGASTSTSTCQPGSQTPTSNGYLVISGTSTPSASTPSINSPFTLIDAGGIIGAQSDGIGSGDYVQPTSAALNPTWTVSGAVDIACMQVSFIP